MKSKISISDHFNYGRLLRYTLPSVVMMVFTSLYKMVDGFFVSNFTGKMPFAAVNFIMPLLMIMGAVGLMFGTGGGALIAKTMGEGKHKKANELFSMMIYISIICGVILALLGVAFIRPIAQLMGCSCMSALYSSQFLSAIPLAVLRLSAIITALRIKMSLKT